MSEFALSPTQQNLLHDLLDREERAVVLSRRISLRVSEARFPQYFDDSNPRAIREWQQDILALEALSWISLDWGHGSEAHRVARISLNRAREADVATAMGRLTLRLFQARLGDLQRKFHDQFTAHREWFPGWWGRFLEREIARAPRVSPTFDQRSEVLAETALLIEALARIVAPRLRRHGGSVAPVTWRQFSVGEFANSKKLNALKFRIIRILAEFTRPGLPFGAADAAAVLAEFGLEIKQEMIMMAGPFSAHSALARNFVIDGSQWRPFAAVARQMIVEHDFKWDFRLCSGVLTIENEESFQSWCRSNSESSLLGFYVGGFPSRYKVDFLRQIPPQFPHFHWGDLDVGGIQIFRYLERELQRWLRPYAMEPSYLSEFSANGQALSVSEVRRLETISTELSASHALQPLIHAMLRLRIKLEQEAIQPTGCSI